MSIPSPCKNKCKLGAGGYCVVCYRTTEEIESWQWLNDMAKAIVISMAEERQKLDEEYATT